MVSPERTCGVSPCEVRSSPRNRRNVYSEASCEQGRQLRPDRARTGQAQKVRSGLKPRGILTLKDGQRVGHYAPGEPRTHSTLDTRVIFSTFGTVDVQESEVADPSCKDG